MNLSKTIEGQPDPAERYFWDLTLSKIKVYQKKSVSQLQSTFCGGVDKGDTKMPDILLVTWWYGKKNQKKI